MANASLRENIELISDKANNDEKSLPFVDKLQLLDKEIRLLQECCLKMGLNSKEIELCAEPLLQERHKESRKRWWRRVLYISALVAFIAFIFWFDPTYRYICIFGRLSSMKVCDCVSQPQRIIKYMLNSHSVVETWHIEIQPGRIADSGRCSKENYTFFVHL